MDAVVTIVVGIATPLFAFMGTLVIALQSNKLMAYRMDQVSAGVKNLDDKLEKRVMERNKKDEELRREIAALKERLSALEVMVKTNKETLGKIT